MDAWHCVCVCFRAYLTTNGALRSSTRITSCVTRTPPFWPCPLSLKRRTWGEWLPSGPEAASLWVDVWQARRAFPAAKRLMLHWPDSRRRSCPGSTVRTRRWSRAAASRWWACLGKGTRTMSATWTWSGTPTTPPSSPFTTLALTSMPWPTRSLSFPRTPSL